ncbi:MAG: hypothetical protein FJX67_18205 [Alphaproteobacteria bacterium]|nr:hypothetical protein [Alphaproteobacteria bacterium]
MTETLALTPDQQKAIRAIFAETRDQAQTMRRQGASADDVQAAMRAARDRSREAIRAILTPEQRPKFEAMNAGRAANPVVPATVWVVGEDGRPGALRISMGAGDGQLTEVVGGPLKDGQEVIVGLADPPRRQPVRRSPF